MISKLDKVMEGLEKEKQLQADAAADKTSEELVRIDEVMNAVRKVNFCLFVCYGQLDIRIK